MHHVLYLRYVETSGRNVGSDKETGFVGNKSIIRNRDYIILHGTLYLNLRIRLLDKIWVKQLLPVQILQPLFLVQLSVQWKRRTIQKRKQIGQTSVGLGLD